MIDLFEEFEFDTSKISEMSDEELEEASNQAFGFIASNLCGDYGPDRWERFNAWYAAILAEQERRSAKV